MFLLVAPDQGITHDHVAYLKGQERARALRGLPR